MKSPAIEIVQAASMSSPCDITGSSASNRKPTLAALFTGQNLDLHGCNNMTTIEHKCQTHLNIPY